MKGNILSVASGVRGVMLFVRDPGYHTGTKRKAVASNRSASFRAVVPVRVTVANGAGDVGSAECQREETSSFQVADNTDSSLPVFGSITIKNGR